MIVVTLARGLFAVLCLVAVGALAIGAAALVIHLVILAVKAGWGLVG